MKRIILTILALTIISSNAHSENESIFIPGLSKEQADKKRFKAIEAANEEMNSQETNNANTAETYRPYQHKPNYKPPAPLPASGASGGPVVPTYSPSTPPQYNP